jgi:hypothetical protein
MMMYKRRRCVSGRGLKIRRIIFRSPNGHLKVKNLKNMLNSSVQAENEVMNV